MIDHLIDVPLTRDNLKVVASPAALHRRMATFLPDLKGRSSAIRADTQTVFRVDLPSDPLGTPGRITLRLRGDAVDPTEATIQEISGIVDGSRIVATVAAERRATVHADRSCTDPACHLTAHERTRTRAVGNYEAVTWARELLQRHGLEATDLAVGPARRMADDGGVRFSVRDICATVRVLDPAKSEDALRRGIGRGKSYGLGMLVPVN